MSLYPFAKGLWIEHDGLGDHFHFFGGFTLVHNFNLFSNVIREILLFYIDHNWRNFLIAVFDKYFWVCWNPCVFSKYFQLQSIIFMLCAQTGSSICNVCKLKLFRPHSSKRCEWTRHVTLVRYKLLMKIALIVLAFEYKISLV